MSFASDQLYNGYLRTNMPTIVTKVKVRQIVVHLPCLTDYDRETIEAKREMCGNFNGMVLLLDCLKRRDSWPEHFIRALEKCEHGAIAAEIRAEYDKLLGAGSKRPFPPVQESAPPVEKVTPAAAIPLDDISEALDNTQIVVENCTAAGSTPASPASPAASDASSVFLSTPRTLASILPQEDPNSNPTGAGSSTEPYSGDTDRLEISKNQDDDDEDEVRVHTVHVSQPLSVLDGQLAVNGDAAKEVASVQEPASTTMCPETEKPAPRGALAANAKFAATAVGVAACALLLAWKFKH
ncbi:mitochondrial antiviral-signaling protein [Hippocampus comes]|uniref:mitochondrial antiviral-signaling protein n=1 Tax=Hippocampus comes TaxID=109280 RepID=UPI00094EC167|nr:PREDICTED: mitochondrial antiviral-signaling protein [Hippocampus comes]